MRSATHFSLPVRGCPLLASRRDAEFKTTPGQYLRTMNGKNRRHQSSGGNNSRHEETRYRGSRHYDGGASITDEYDEGGDDDGRIQLLGLTFSNPLPVHFRKHRLPSFVRAVATNHPVTTMAIVISVVVACIVLSVVLASKLFDHSSLLGDVRSSLRLSTPSILFTSPRQQGRSIDGRNEGENDNNGIVGAALPHVTNDGKFHGRYPNSLLTLFYPLTLYSDVVLDQPVDPGDVPFFWHPHVSDEVPVKAVLERCYGAEIVEMNSMHDIIRARDDDLIRTLVGKGRIGKMAVDADDDSLYGGQRRMPLIIASPHIHAAAELFSQDNFGRIFAFYRHPIDYDIHPELLRSLPSSSEAAEATSSDDNFLTRLLSNASSHAGGRTTLTYKELGTAKQIIRQITIVGTRDLMSESIFRIGKYHGWVPIDGRGTRESSIDDDVIAKSCIDDIVKDIPGELYADHDSKEWNAFYDANKLDCELYEIARSTWRAQIQTIIPLTLQKRRAGEIDDDDEEEKEDEDEE